MKTSLEPQRIAASTAQLPFHQVKIPVSICPTNLVFHIPNFIMQFLTNGFIYNKEQNKKSISVTLWIRSHESLKQIVKERERKRWIQKDTDWQPDIQTKTSTFFSGGQSSKDLEKKKQGHWLCISWALTCNITSKYKTLLTFSLPLVLVLSLFLLSLPLWSLLLLSLSLELL